MPEQHVERVAADLGTILSVWAHPDDETFLAGGIMAAAVDNGQTVVCVTATAGERGTDDPDRWPPERLGRVRRWEAAAAMAVLGVGDHRVLGLPDGGLAGLNPDEPVAWVAGLIDEVRPDTILTFGPEGGTFHPDHQAVSAWAREAWLRHGAPGRLLYAALAEDHLDTWGDLFEKWGVFMTDQRPVGVPADGLAVDVELDEARLDQKIAALHAMHTQIAPSVAVLGENAFRSTNARETFVAAPDP